MSPAEWTENMLCRGEGARGQEEWQGVERREKIKMDNIGIYINVTDK